MAQTAQPLVSVVVPSCGRPSLRRALLSLREQTWDRWECHVVCDAPARLAEVRAAVDGLADARIAVIANRAPIGPSGSRAAAVAAGSGPIVAFLDDDDVWLPRKLEWHVEEHERCPSGCVVYSDVAMAWEEDILAPCYLKQAPAPPQPFAEMLDGRFMVVTMSSLSAHRSCLEAVGGFDPKLRHCEDQDLLLKLSQRFPLRHLARPALIYVQHLGSHVSTDAPGQIAGLEILARRWGIPELDQRRWLRDRVALNALLARDRERGLPGRLAVLASFGRVARPPSYGRLRWVLDAALGRPRAFLRLCGLALGGTRLFRRLQDLRGRPDPALRELVAGYMGGDSGREVARPAGGSVQPSESRPDERASSRTSSP